LIAKIGAHVDRENVRADDDCLAGIDDLTGRGCVGRLRVSKCRERKDRPEQHDDACSLRPLRLLSEYGMERCSCNPSKCACHYFEADSALLRQCYEMEFSPWSGYVYITWRGRQ